MDIVLQLFFPVHGGDYSHFYVFVIDFKRKQKTVLNSIDCSREFDAHPRYKQTFRRLVEYVNVFCMLARAANVLNFEWRVMDAPQQPDTYCCGLFMLYFMEHYDGAFTPVKRALWGSVGELSRARRHCVNRLVTDENNQEFGKIVSMSLSGGVFSSTRRGRK
ncbi:hypothetical protein LINPERHAP1_LOCUS26345 [Linum perenne]